MASPLIITVAPNGAYKQHSDHAAVPITAAQLAQTAVQCRDAGAAMLHLHIRDNDGRHSLDVQGYRDALAQVRAAVGQGMVLQVTSEAARIYAPQAQMAMVRALRPGAGDAITDRKVRDAVADFEDRSRRRVARGLGFVELAVQRFGTI